MSLTFAGCKNEARRRLHKTLYCGNFSRMKRAEVKVDTAWRKSRLAARLLIRKESRPLSPREVALARRLSQDSEVTNRLIQQALYFLGVGPRKHAFDQKLVGGGN
jgi:hypothetical protein